LIFADTLAKLVVFPDAFGPTKKITFVLLGIGFSSGS